MFLRPPLKWAGGKNHLLPILAKLYEPHRDKRLVEPFCGAANVALGLEPKRALLNDINQHLIAFWLWVQRNERPRMRFDHDERRYYIARRKFNKLVRSGVIGGREIAELFYYLNKTCFNGLCRYNPKGEFNVPFGQHNSIRYVRDFSEWAKATAKWEFTAGEFDTVEVKTSDWAYSDPPYDSTFSDYAKDGFRWDDQVRLAIWLAKHKGPVVASNAATPRILKLYRGLGFKVKTLSAPRRISSDGDRASAREMLATKNL